MECVLAKNGVRMYYIEGKHVSHEFAKIYAQKTKRRMATCKEVSENSKMLRLKRRILALTNRLKALSGSSQPSNPAEYIGVEGEVNKEQDMKDMLKEAQGLQDQISVEKTKSAIDIDDVKAVFQDFFKNMTSKIGQVIEDKIDQYLGPKEVRDAKEREAKKMMESAQNKINELDQNEKDLKNVITQLEERLKPIEERLNELSSPQDDKQKIIVDDKINKLEEIVKGLKDELEVEKEKNIDQLKKSVETAKPSTLVSEQEKKELEQKIADLNFKLAEYEVMNNNLKQALESSSPNIQDLKEKVDQYETRINELGIENKLLKEEGEKETNKLKDVNKKLAEQLAQKKEIEQLEKEQQDIQQQMAGQQNIQELQDQLRKVTEEKKQQEQDLKKEIKKLNIDIDQMRKIEEPTQKEIVQKQQEQAQKEKDELIKQLKQQEEQITKLKDDAQKASKELDFLKEQTESVAKPTEKLDEQSDIKEVQEKIVSAEEAVKEEIKNVEELDEKKPDLLREKLSQIIENIKEMEAVTDQLRNDLTRVRKENIANFLDSINLNIDTYPILLQLKDTSLSGEKKFKRTVDLLMNMTKSLLITTRLFTRNPIFMRLISISREDFDEVFKKEDSKLFKDIIEQLYYIPITNDYITESLDQIKDMLRSKSVNRSKNLLYLGMKDDYYTKFLEEIVNDSKDVKQVKTETFLHGIIKILTNLGALKDKELKQYSNLVSLLLNMIRNSIQRNEILLKIDNIISQTLKETLKEFHNKNTNVFTFIKMRSDDPNDINKRFNIKIDQEEKTMLIGYDPTTKPFYQDNVPIAGMEPNYRDNYIFGPFTKIYKPYLSNKQIAEERNCRILVDRLRAKKPVVIVGYGASGSGKTSTLVNFFSRKTMSNEAGIMIHMANQLQDTYKKLEVSFVELEGDVSKDDPVKNYKIRPYENDISKSNREQRHMYMPQNFIINDKNNWIVDRKKFPTKTLLTSYDQPKKVTYYSDGDWELSDYVATILDGARTVKATTNNPESSRSHMLIFLKFMKEDGEHVYMVICDFAGVENKFDCSLDEVLQQFLSIKERAGKKLFYNDELEQAVIDRFGFPSDTFDGTTFKMSQEDIKKYIIENGEKTKKALDELFELWFEKTMTESKKIFVFINDSDIQEKLSNYAFTILKKIVKNDSLKRHYRELNEAFKIAFDDTSKDTFSLYNRFRDLFAREQSKIIKYEKVKEICQFRVKEGLFINDSLEKFRYAITDFILNIANKKEAEYSQKYPPFNDMCIPFQCNPYFEDCFGSSLSQKSDGAVSLIMTEILKKLCPNENKESCNAYQEMNLVIFNILNVSKSANNPPPLAYTDISGLLAELARLDSLKAGLGDENLLSDDMNPLTGEKYVRQAFLDDLKNRETIKSYEPSVVSVIMSMISQLEQRGGALSQQIINLENLIQFINKINAVTAIGTMEFSDMIAKYGMNRSICNYRMLTNEEMDGYTKEFPEELRDQMITKLQEYRTSLLVIFDDLFVKSYFK